MHSLKIQTLRVTIFHCTDLPVYCFLFVFFATYLVVYIDCIFGTQYLLSRNICHGWGNGKKKVRLMMKHI